MMGSAPGVAESVDVSGRPHRREGRRSQDVNAERTTDRRTPRTGRRLNDTMAQPRRGQVRSHVLLVVGPLALVIELTNR